MPTEEGVPPEDGSRFTCVADDCVMVKQQRMDGLERKFAQLRQGMSELLVQMDALQAEIAADAPSEQEQQEQVIATVLVDEMEAGDKTEHIDAAQCGIRAMIGDRTVSIGDPHCGPVQAHQPADFVIKTPFNGRCFVLSYDVRFRSFDENYSHCIKSSTNAFQTCGMGPPYRGDRGKVTFYLHTTTGKGRHGRGELYNDNDGCLISKNKLDVDEWYRIDIHKEPTSQHLRVTNLSSGESAISDIASLQPGALAEDFIMKDPGDITPDNGHSDRMVRNMKWKNINPDAARVWSLEGGPDICYWNWMSAQGEILFHLNPRPKTGDVLVMNHNPDQRHTWNAATTRCEERCNYAAAKLSNGRFAFTVMVDAEGYHVSTREGKKLHSFRHRLGWDSFSHVGYSDGLCCLEK